MSITRTTAVGVLSLVAAGAIGGTFAVALSQGSTSKPTELRQVVQTTTTTPTSATTTTTPVATTTTTAPKVATTTRKPSVSPKVQAVAPDPSPSQTTPQPVTTTPAGTTPVGTPIPRPPAGDEGNAPRYCGGVTVCTNTK
jgi:hypothetical protein